MPVADQRARHLGPQVGRRLQRSSATPSASRTTVHSPTPVHGAGQPRWPGADGADDLDLDRRRRRPCCVASSSSVPWATISPSWITSRRSQVWLISDRMWLDSRMVCSPRSSRISGAHLDDLHRVEAAGRLVEDEQLRACARAPAPRRRAGGSRATGCRSARRAPRGCAVFSSASATARGRRRPAARRAARRRRPGSRPRSSRRRAAACRAESRCACGSRADRAATSMPSMRHARRRSASSTQPSTLSVVDLAGAVEAEEADDLAALDGEGQVADGGVLAVVLGQAFDFDHEG